jgi:hypothetical protein
MIRPTTAKWFLLIVTLVVTSGAPLLAQSEFVPSGRDAIEVLGGYSSSSEAGGPTVAAGASIKGWADLGLAAGYFTRNHLTVKAVALHADLLFVKQTREQTPFSLALTGSAEVNELKITYGYRSGSATATLATAGLAAFRCFQVGRTVRVVPMIGASRIFGINPSDINRYSGGGSLSFAFDGAGRSSVIAALGVNVVDDVATVSLGLGVLLRQRR